MIHAFFALLLAATSAHAHDGVDYSADEHAELIREARASQLAEEEGYLAEPKDFVLEILKGKSACRFISGLNRPAPNMRVALTFDDGPDSRGAPYVMEVLAKYNLPATFFVQGKVVKARPALFDRLAGTPKVIVANHSWNHDNFHLLSSAAQSQQIVATDNLLGTRQNPKIFRYPYGNSTCFANDLAHSQGYKIAGWHVDSCDWGFNKTGRVSAKDAKLCAVSARNIANFRGHVVEKLKQKKGGILLMHDVQPNTIKQLDLLVQELLREGFTFGGLDEPAFQFSLR